MLASAGMEGGFALVLSRAVSVAALLSVFGTLVFAVFVAPRAAAKMPLARAAAIARGLRLMVQAGCAACLAATLAWLILQAADMAGADSPLAALRALPAVVTGTSFGHLVVAQLAVIAAVAPVLGRGDRRTRVRAALAVATVAAALHAGHSHATAMPGSGLLLAAVVLHLWGAGAWLGGLLPLLLVIRMAPARAAATAARWFSPLGKLCIAALVVSAGYQGWVVVGDIPRLVGTAYGLTILVKLGLLGVLLGFAWINRHRFAPALLHAAPDHARRVLVGSIAVQTGCGLAVVVAAAVLSNLPPAMHVQPWWPFPEQFSLDAAREDPELRLELIKGAVNLAAALALLLVAVLLPRVRWPVMAAAAVAAWLSVPHLKLLLVDADPTTFYQSPTDFAATTIMAGAELYPQHCAVCHGIEGRGDGPAAKALPVPPADLTAAHLLMHSDGDLFWWLTHGIPGPDGRPVMPGFGEVLSADARWDLIDYLHARNVGGVMAQTGAWPDPVQAPDLQATCRGQTVTLADLRGRFVRLVIGPPPPSPDAAGSVTIATAPAPAPASGGAGGVCRVDDAAVPLAYAVVSGGPADRLAGTQFLIDGSGLLRALQHPGAPGSWNDPAALTAEIAALRAHPIAARDRMDMPM